MQNWDFFGTKFGLWSHLGPSPKFGTSVERLTIFKLPYHSEAPVANFFLRISAKILSISKNFCQNFCQNSTPKST